MSKFNEIKNEYIERLELYVPIVARVHGGTHPEFLEVHKLFDEMNKKMKESGENKPEIEKEFIELRRITDNYTVPSDTCESYEAVYSMLSEMDKAYNA